jgi:hypothetical protein
MSMNEFRSLAAKIDQHMQQLGVVSEGVEQANKQSCHQPPFRLGQVKPVFMSRSNAHTG